MILPQRALPFDLEIPGSVSKAASKGGFPARETALEMCPNTNTDEDFKANTAPMSVLPCIPVATCGI